MFNVQDKKMQKQEGGNKGIQYLEDKQGTESNQGKWDTKTEGRLQEVKEDKRRKEKKVNSKKGEKILRKCFYEHPLDLLTGMET